MILTKNTCFQNIKIKLNSWTWLTLQSSVVIFHASEPLQHQWPLQPQQPQWPLQPHFIKRILILMVRSSLTPKWSKPVPLCGMDHQKSRFLLYLSEAVEACGCYFFENWLMKRKCPNLLKPLDHNSTKLLILLPLRAIYLVSSISIWYTLYEHFPLLTFLFGEFFMFPQQPFLKERRKGYPR